MNFLSRFFGTFERPSPQDWIHRSGIKYLETENVVEVGLFQLALGLDEKPCVWIPEIPNTNSMDPLFDFGHNNILIAGRNEDDHDKIVDFLKVGDIAVYRTDTMYAIHRIVDIKEDKEGKYFRFKGDNNPVKDPDKVRQYEILWVSIGTIY